MSDRYHLVEEVPGVPKAEQYYVNIGYAPPLAYFRTFDEAKFYLESVLKITDYDIDRFEP